MNTPICIPIQIRMHPLLLTVLPFVTLFTTHYGATHLYSHLCVPLSVTGFFTSLITTASPICSGLFSGLGCKVFLVNVSIYDS